jgi:hypothetical protein
MPVRAGVVMAARPVPDHGGDLMKVTTDHKPRDIIDASGLTPAEREEFDYLKWEAIDAGKDSASFVRYRGQLYDLGECMALHAGPLADAGWQGYWGESYFSAVVMHYAGDPHDSELVIMGRAYE